ncbi:TPA: hypothetical protein DCX16_00580 [bacterium]|nr:hypothetical protein [bacterium]
MIVHDYYLSETNLNSGVNDQELGIEVGRKKKKIGCTDKNYNQFYPLKDDLQSLPQNSTLIKISFTLKKPYTSKDEGEFHIIDGRIFENPIIRDKFLGLAMVRPSTWKGHLRFSAEKVNKYDDKKKREIIRRLFGSEAGEENALKGILYFFPTFFEKDAEKDVITPLNRKTRTPVGGKSPINLEVMKPEQKGDFYLLYFPYPKGEESEIKEDLRFLFKALGLMFYTYGFSAKKTSNFGVIKESLDEGKLWTKSNGEIKEKDFLNLDDLTVE